MEHSLYPFKFSPVLKEKIWGGNKIKETLGVETSPLLNCGEAWVLSGVEGNPTLVRNGYLEGNELNELVEVYMGDLVGDEVYNVYGNEFPILVKFIDAADYLSIQVHPDDELASKRGIGNGKSEMWYIMNSDNDAELIAGFKKDCDRNTLVKHLKEKRITELLNVERVSAGDAFYIPAGRVHAIGPGILLAEIQQTSDNTYRIYDWDRVDEKGNSRELHVEESLDAIDFKAYDNYKSQYTAKINGSSNLITSPFFTSNIIHCDKTLAKDYTELDSFVIYVCVEGKVMIVHDGLNEPQVLLSKGEAILIPAIIDRIDLIPIESTRILEVFIA